jgi:uncharacterized protein
MKISVGNPVEGDDFFDREQEQVRAWRKLEGSHLLMLAPRRIGKTSLILRLCATASEHGRYAVHCSFAKCETECDCIRELFKALANQQTIGQRSKVLFDSIKSVKLGPLGVDWHEAKPESWREVGEELARALAESDDDWLVCIDELPVFIINLLQQGEEGRRRARAFLYWLRDLRQNHYRRIKWLMAGSIGLDTLAARLRLTDSINDLEPFPLEAFSEDSALRFLDKLAGSYGLQLNEELRKGIITRVGWPVPYYLQLMFSHLRDESLDSGVPPNAAMIETVFEKLLGNSYRTHFDYWHQRLEEELGQPDAGQAALILTRISRSTAGETRETLAQAMSTVLQDPQIRDQALHYLLDVLRSDGYLVEREGRYAFRLEWLRVYWQRRFAA